MPHDSDEEHAEFSELEVKDDHSYSSPNPNCEDKLLSPLAKSPRFLRPTSHSNKYEPSQTMTTFMNDVLPHMVSDNVTHTHTLDESMYGRTLTLGGQEASFGQVMFGKSDSFAVPILVMFSFIGAEGMNKDCPATNPIKSTFPFFSKARRMQSIHKFVAGTTDLKKLQEDVVLQSKSVKGHLNVTFNEVKVPDEKIPKPEMYAPDKSPEKLSDQEYHPPLDKSVEQAADDMKGSLFSGKPDYPQESDYFATENETDGEAGSVSPIFRVNNPLPTEADDGKENAQVDTSNEIICPTQMHTGSDLISTVGLVEVEALSSPMVPSRQPQHDENVNATEQSNGHDSENTDVPEEGVDDSISFPADDSSINNEDPFLFKKDVTRHPFPEYNIPLDVKGEDNASIDSGIHSSSAVLHEHNSGVDGDEHEHGVDGSEHEQVGGEQKIVNEDVIYNQEVITLNRNMDMKKNLGPDCVIQAQGESKLVVSV